MYSQEFISPSCTAAHRDVGIAFVQTMELPFKPLSWVPCVWKGSTVWGEDGTNGARSCVIRRAPSTWRSYHKGGWGWILLNKMHIIVILSLDSTVLFLVSCAALHSPIKVEYKNLLEDLISALLRLFCLDSDENVRQALQNYFCGFSSQLLFPSYCHI